VIAVLFLLAVFAVLVPLKLRAGRRLKVQGRASEACADGEHTACPLCGCTCHRFGFASRARIEWIRRS